PDSAILGVVVPAAELDDRIATFAQSEDGASRSTGWASAAPADADLKRHFVDTQKYGELPARRGLDRGAFGLFVDPVHCKGCAECVDVCSGLGHDALIMIDKAPSTDTTDSTIAHHDRGMRFLRSLPPTPTAYRNEKALADLMLGEDAF